MEAARSLLLPPKTTASFQGSCYRQFHSVIDVSSPLAFTGTWCEGGGVRAERPATTGARIGGWGSGEAGAEVGPFRTGPTAPQRQPEEAADAVKDIYAWLARRDRYPPDCHTLRHKRHALVTAGDLVSLSDNIHSIFHGVLTLLC
ncbi:hypothetical protein OPV22_028246 [Ensete ventricosum]|uniref:Uncharacterized protein n=1 Tax=Ensete ventricosum TaxID=4639 RepID=A0AAV8Q314_ENSVE|nr:hypothetical protein OPV22_028246 [Ensete ventricosum]